MFTRYPRSCQCQLFNSERNNFWRHNFLLRSLHHQVDGRPAEREGNTGEKWHFIRKQVWLVGDVLFLTVSKSMGIFQEYVFFLRLRNDQIEDKKTRQAAKMIEWFGFLVENSMCQKSCIYFSSTIFSLWRWCPFTNTTRMKNI